MTSSPTDFVLYEHNENKLNFSVRSFECYIEKDGIVNVFVTETPNNRSLQSTVAMLSLTQEQLLDFRDWINEHMDNPLK